MQELRGGRGWQSAASGLLYFGVRARQEYLLGAHERLGRPLLGRRKKASCGSLSLELEMSDNLPDWQGAVVFGREFQWKEHHLQRPAEQGGVSRVCVCDAVFVETCWVPGLCAERGTGREDVVEVSISSFLGSRRPLSLHSDKRCID